VYVLLSCSVVCPQDPSQPGRQSATRILVLSSGSVQFELIVQRDVTGVVTKEAPNLTTWQPRSPNKVRLFILGHHLDSNNLCCRAKKLNSRLVKFHIPSMAPRKLFLIILRTATTSKMFLELMIRFVCVYISLQFF
jgi:hypothetical protein